MAIGKDDIVVRNTTSIEIIDKIGNPANRVIEIEGADHTTISIDLDLSSKVIRNSIDFLDAIVDSRQEVKADSSLIEWTVIILVI